MNENSLEKGRVLLVENVKVIAIISPVTRRPILSQKVSL